LNETILDHIPLQIDRSELVERLHLKPGSPYLQELEDLAEQAGSLARPKAAYHLSFIDSSGPDTIVVDGITFTSRVLRANLGNAQRVFPYLVTCGTEIEAWADAIQDPLLRFWADAIMEVALACAGYALHDHIDRTYQPGPLASMNPGSLEDWPLAQQRPLFRLMDDSSQAIGIQLTGSLLMIPAKSISGIYFPNQENFASCMLCPRDRCPNRRAPYDPERYRQVLDRP
jgi:hypothetical protein